jgi:hypothetical protein
MKHSIFILGNNDLASQSSPDDQLGSSEHFAKVQALSFYGYCERTDFVSILFFYSKLTI